MGWGRGRLTHALAYRSYMTNDGRGGALGKGHRLSITKTSGHNFNSLVFNPYLPQSNVEAKT